MENIAIKATSNAHGAEIIKFFMSEGATNPTGYKGKAKYCYFVDGGIIKGQLLKIPNGYSVVTLEEVQKPKTNPYPKVMWVWDNDGAQKKRVVFLEKCGLYIAWSNAETIEQSEKTTDTTAWPYAKDIEPEPEIKEPTLSQIADKFGVSVDKIRIKD